MKLKHIYIALCLYVSMFFPTARTHSPWLGWLAFSISPPCAHFFAFSKQFWEALALMTPIEFHPEADGIRMSHTAAKGPRKNRPVLWLCDLTDATTCTIHIDIDGEDEHARRWGFDVYKTIVYILYHIIITIFYYYVILYTRITYIYIHINIYILYSVCIYI